jgi:hypothetical protein
MTGERKFIYMCQQRLRPTPNNVIDDSKLDAILVTGIQGVLRSKCEYTNYSVSCGCCDDDARIRSCIELKKLARAAGTPYDTFRFNALSVNEEMAAILGRNMGKQFPSNMRGMVHFSSHHCIISETKPVVKKAYIEFRNAKVFNTSPRGHDETERAYDDRMRCAGYKLGKLLHTVDRAGGVCVFTGSFQMGHAAEKQLGLLPTAHWHVMSPSQINATTHGTTATLIFYCTLFYLKMSRGTGIAAAAQRIGFSTLACTEQGCLSAATTTTTTTELASSSGHQCC